MISPDPLSPIPSTSSALNIFGPSASLVETEQITENKEGNPNTPEPEAEGDIQMEYSSVSCAHQILGALTTNYLKERRLL